MQLSTGLSQTITQFPREDGLGEIDFWNIFFSATVNSRSRGSLRSRISLVLELEGGLSCWILLLGHDFEKCLLSISGSEVVSRVSLQI